MIADYLPRLGNIDKHGLSKHPLYTVWKSIMEAAYYKYAASYQSVGAIGIQVCDRWHDLRNFVADVKDRPDGLIFSRLDKTKDYSPENYCWESRLESSKRANNAKKLTGTDRLKIFELKKANMPNKVIAKQFGVHPVTISKIYNGRRWRIVYSFN